MKASMIAAGLGLAALAAPQAQAGCLKGAAIGGVAGHVAGHHGVLGAAAGCAIGHHESNREARYQDRRYNGNPNPNDAYPSR